jgi:hypothetical protein
MRIDITEKLIPYSQTPGISLILPKTFFCLQIFPTRICFEEKESKQKFFIDWKLSGLGEFFVFQDLEKEQILVDWRREKTSFRFSVKAENNRIFVFIEKAPEEGVFYTITPNACNDSKEISSESVSRPQSEWFFDIEPKKEKIFSKEEIKISLENNRKDIDKNMARDLVVQNSGSKERLFLGMTKSLEIEKVQRRKNLQELLPLWMFLGQKTPTILPASRKKHQGTAFLLEKIENLLKDKEEKIQIEKLFLSLYLAGFSLFFSPRLRDEQHQGIISEAFEKEISLDASPFILLEEGSKLIRSLFFREEGLKEKEKKEERQEEENGKRKAKLFLLPTLLPSFHSGKMINLSFSLGTIDMEWAKKLLKKVVVSPRENGKIELNLQPAIKKFRVREFGKRKKDFGKVFSAHEPIDVKKGQKLFLDHFEK